MRVFRGSAFRFVTILTLGFAAVAQTPQPQTEIVEGVQREIEKTDAMPLAKVRFELPVEAKNADGTPRLSKDGKRQFELRFHQDNGSDTIGFITPIPTQENLEKPTVFYRDDRENGEIVRHYIYTVLPQEQSGGIIILMASTFYKSTKSAAQPAQTPSAPPAADGAYHVGKYPVHTDKDSYSRLFYHLTIIEGQPPVTVVPRVSSDAMGQKSKIAAPGRTLGQWMGMPNAGANIMAGMDFTEVQTKNGDRWRDWMFVDARNNITYFQLMPTHKLQKNKDGAWDVHVSKDPPPLIDIRKTK